MLEKKRTSVCRGGFTLIELLVVVAIIAILAGLAFPVFTSVQRRTRAPQDLNNVRQIEIAMQSYLNDREGVYFLPSTDWMLTLKTKYVSGWKIFLSPFDRRNSMEDDANAPISYGFNRNSKVLAGGLATDQIVRPSEFIVFAPVQPFTQITTSTSCVVTQDSAGPGGVAAGGTHGQGTHINACFADLHVENLLWSVFQSDDPAAGSSDSASARWHPHSANTSL